MSIQAVAYAIDLREGPSGDRITPSEKLLVICIANRINPDHGNRCWLSVPRIAEEMGVPERRVQILLRSTEGKGLVSVVEHFGKDGHQTTNSYRLPDLEQGRDRPDPHDQPDDDEAAREQERGETARLRDADERATLPGYDRPTPPGVDGVTGPSRGGVDGVTGPVSTGSPAGVDGVTLTVRGTVGEVTARTLDPEEEPNFGASAGEDQDQATIHAVGDDFTPTPVTALGRRQEQIEAVVREICGRRTPSRDDEDLIRRVQGRLRRGEIRPGEVVAAVDRLRERETMPATSTGVPDRRDR